MTVVDGGGGKLNDMANNLNQAAPRRQKKDPLGKDYNVQDTVTSQFSIGSIRLNLGKAPPQKKHGVLADGGRLIASIYALMLILFGMAFPVKEALKTRWLTTYVEAVFLAYLYGVSFIAILYIEIYLVQKARKHGHERKEEKEKPQILVRDRHHTAEGTYDTITGKYTSNSENQNTIRSLDELSTDNGMEVYILEQGSDNEPPLPHHTSLYIRFGAIIFGLGNMVYDGLLLNQIQTNSSNLANCLQESFVWPHYMHLGFLLAQTYFIFKHPQVHITFTKPLARLGFMHMFATNACVWFRTLIRETLESFLHHSDKGHGKDGDDHGDITHHNETQYDNKSHADPLGCNYGDDLLMKASPYLFPCVLEYSLLAAAVMFSMYADVGSVTRSMTSSNVHPTDNNSSSSSSHMVTEINFHRSHKGMFAGVVVIAATCVSIVLFFSYAEASMPVAEMIYLNTMIALYGLLLFVTAIAFIQLQRLKFNRCEQHKSVDDVMLLAATAGLILFMILKILPTVDILYKQTNDLRSILSLTASLLALVVGFVHTAVIIDGMRRYTHTKSLNDSKPGRGAIMFLLCINVALWLFRTFHMKEVEYASIEQEDAYGYLAWQLMLHALVPLLIFYHFHCSACLAHIWSTSYSRSRIKEKVCPEKSPSTQIQLLNNSYFGDHHMNQQSDVKSCNKHEASSDLVPDRIIEFQRHGKAPRAMNAPVHTLVESIESPLDTEMKKPMFPQPENVES